MRLLGSAAATVQAIRRDQRGAVLIYVTLALPVFLGLGLLAVDVGRIYNLNTHLQKSVDALALAAAAELDGRDDATDRAENAIETLLENEQRFAAGDIRISIEDLEDRRYLHSLPPDDAQPITSAYEINPDKQAQARFVEVTVKPYDFFTLFPASIVGAVGRKEVSATAVAGFTSVACKVVPMFVCNPFQDPNDPDDTALFNGSVVGTQIRMQLGNGGGPGEEFQYFPGSFGWLEWSAYGKPGAPGLKEALGMTNPPVCFQQNGNVVPNQTGNIEVLSDFINVRFDLYKGEAKKHDNDPDYRPAKNVRKGFDDDPCKQNSAPVEGSTDVLRDTFDPGSRVGNKDWKFDEYYKATYCDENEVCKAEAELGFPLSWRDGSVRPTRHQVYLKEIEAGLVDVENPKTQEKGKPICYIPAADTLTDNPDRRKIYAAIINCGGLSGPQSELPVRAFGEFFLTEPVRKSPDPDAGTIFGEFLGVAEPGEAEDVVRDVVQLYR